jgi:hypothetical protein
MILVLSLLRVLKTHLQTYSLFTTHGVCRYVLGYGSFPLRTALPFFSFLSSPPFLDFVSRLDAHLPPLLTTAIFNYSRVKSPDMPSDPPTCKKWLQGACKHGEQCRYSHDSKPASSKSLSLLLLLSFNCFFITGEDAPNTFYSPRGTHRFSIYYENS